MIKIGAVPRAGAVQIVPPYYAYSGNRGMRRALFDLKADAGREAFLRLAETCDVLIESFRPGVADKLGIGDGDVRARNSALVYCSTTGYGQTGPRSTWAGHDLNYLATSGFLHCSGRRHDGRPALPGASVADIAAGGMQAAMAIMAALLRRERTGEGELPRRVDRRWGDGDDVALRRRVPRHRHRAGPGPLHPHRALRVLRRVRVRRRAIPVCGGHRAASSGRNLCRLHRSRTLRRRADRRRNCRTRSETPSPPFSSPAAATSGWPSWDPPTPAWHRSALWPRPWATSSIVARGAIVDAVHEEHGPFRQAAPIWAGTEQPDNAVRDPRRRTVTDTATLLADVGYRAGGNRWHWSSQE